MKLYELFDAQERFQLLQLMNNSFATILAKQAKATKSQHTPKIIKPTAPTQKKLSALTPKSPKPFNKAPRSKRQLAAIKPQSTQ